MKTFVCGLEGDNYYVPHVWFRLDLTGWCEHCDAEYKPELPATLEAIAEQHEEFMREHEECER